MWDQIKRVSFELSNRCTMAGEHAKCPLHSHAGEPRHLPAKWVLQAILELGDHGFDGTIAFHTYCEPMIDPRLFVLVSGAKDLCPDANVFLMTNGWNLDQQLLDELAAFGNVTRMEATGYTPQEVERLQRLTAPDGMDLRVVARPGLDDRLCVYERDPRPPKDGPWCLAPFDEVVVRCTGDIALCCMDWKSSVTFGNVKDGLAPFVSSQEARSVHDELKVGKRTLAICKRCGASRRGGADE